MDLVLRPAARPHQLPAPRQPPAHHPRALVGHPDRVQRPGRQQPRQRPRVEPVGLRPGLTDPRIRRAHDQHLRDMRLDDPRDLPRVALTSSATRSSGPKAPREQLELLRLRLTRPAERTSPSSTIATSQKSRCTSNPTALTTHLPRAQLEQSGRRSGQTTPTDSRSKRNRTSRRGGHRKARAQSPSRKNRPAQHAFSRKPLSQSPEPNPRRPEQQPSRCHFHAPTSARLRSGARDARFAIGKERSRERETRRSRFVRSGSEPRLMRTPASRATRN